MTEDDVRALIEEHPVEGAPGAMREAFERLAASAGAPDLSGLSVTESSDEDAPYIVLQPDRPSGAPIVHLHGGGYVFGSPRSHLALGASLARASGRVVILLGYPLAPEAPWPAQRDAVMAFLAAIGPPFVLSGDSAGGHLALSCALSGAKAEALLLFSPNTSRAYGRSRTRGCGADAMNDHETDDRLAAMAFGRTMASDPDQTPVDRDLSSLPPVYLDVGEDEVLLDDARALAARLEKDGVGARLALRPGFHMIQLFAAGYAPGRESVEAAARWLTAQA